MTLSLEAAISFDEKIELLKKNGLATAMAKETQESAPEPAKAKTAKAAAKQKRRAR